MSYEWKNILVSPQTSIKEVLKTIDNEALKLALVVDEGNRLVGTVSDGDIRRALINDKSLDSSISDIVNKTPTTVDASTPRHEILELMSERNILAIPKLNKGEVVGLETLIINRPDVRHDNPVFLMAGGFGTRLRPLTDNCPKPLLKIGNRPILETVLRSFVHAGFKNFYVSTHYLPDMISDYFGDGSKWGVNIKYVHEKAPLGTGGALGLLPSNRPDLPIIVMNGDILTKVDFEKVLNHHLSHKASATICVREFEYQVPYGVIDGQGIKITKMTEKPTVKYHVNAGIYIIENRIAKTVKKNERIDMPTLLQRHLSENIVKFPFKDYWLDIGQMDDFSRAQQDIHSLGIN